MYENEYKWVLNRCMSHTPVHGTKQSAQANFQYEVYSSRVVKFQVDDLDSPRADKAPLAGHEVLYRAANTLLCDPNVEGVYR